jgi:hypothetical protein
VIRVDGKRLPAWRMLLHILLHAERQSAIVGDYGRSFLDWVTNDAAEFRA